MRWAAILLLSSALVAQGILVVRADNSHVIQSGYGVTQDGPLRITVESWTTNRARLTIENRGKPEWKLGQSQVGDRVFLSTVMLGTPPGWQVEWAAERLARKESFQFEGMDVWTGFDLAMPFPLSDGIPETKTHWLLDGGQSISWLIYAPGNEPLPDPELAARLLPHFGTAAKAPRHQRLASLWSDTREWDFGWYLRNYGKRFSYGKWPELRGPALWGIVPWVEGDTNGHYGPEVYCLERALRTGDQSSWRLARLITERKLTMGFTSCDYREPTDFFRVDGIFRYEKSGGNAAPEFRWKSTTRYRFPEFSHQFGTGPIAISYLSGDPLLKRRADEHIARLMTCPKGRIWQGNYGTRSAVWALETLHAARIVRQDPAITARMQSLIAEWKPLLMTGGDFWPSLDAPATLNPWMDLLLCSCLDMWAEDPEIRARAKAVAIATTRVGIRRVRSEGGQAVPDPAGPWAQAAMVAGRTDRTKDIWQATVLLGDCIAGASLAKDAEPELWAAIVRTVEAAPWLDYGLIGKTVGEQENGWASSGFPGSMPKAACAMARAGPWLP
jgi:hypothetical protein